MKTPFTLKNCFCYLSCFFLLTGIPWPNPIAASPDTHFIRLTPDDGLTHPHVKCLLQDSKGFLWIGTANRLNCYDGIRLTAIDCYDDSLHTGNNCVNALLEDRDNRLWIGTDRGIFIYNMRTERMKKITGKNAPQNWVESLRQTPNGDIWCCVPDEGIFRFLKGNEKHTKIYHIGANSTGSFVDRNGTLWVGAYKNGIYRYHPLRDNFEHIQKGIERMTINAFAEYKDHLLLTAYEEGLFILNRTSGHATKMNIKWQGSPFFHTLMVRDNEAWQATTEGIYVIDLNTGTYKLLHASAEKDNGLSDNNVSSILFDRHNGIWIGTALGGINYIPDKATNIKRYTTAKGNLTSNKIRGMAEDPYGNIWIGTEDGGLNKLDTHTGNVKPYIYPNDGIDHSHIINLYIHDGKLYCSLFRHGMDIIDLETGKLTHDRLHYLKDTDQTVWSMLQDRRGRLWTGAAGGAFITESGASKKVKEIGNDWIFHISEDQQGNVWFCSRGNGLYMLDAKGKWHRYRHDDKRKNSLSSDAVNSVMTDSKGCTWFSTERGGISLYRPQTDDFESIGIADGMPDDIVYTVVEDRQNQLWFGTNRGLINMNPETKKLRIFSVKNGLPGNQFNYHSALVAQNGLLYIGGLSGIAVIDPMAFEDIPYPLDIYITRMAIYNKPILPGQEDSPLAHSIMDTDKITLKHNQNNLTISVSIPTYDNPGAVNCLYRLTPLEKSWTKAPESREINYAQLPPGKYVFETKASSNGKDLSPIRTLALNITPPWWQTPWARVIYVILLAGIISGWFIRYHLRKKRQIEERMRLFAIKKEKELNEAKVNLFTQIAHEIRTPLTLIEAPLEAVIKMNSANETHYLEVMRMNVRRLTNLVTQLLDFQRTGTNDITSSKEPLNLSALLHETLQRFEPTAIQKGLRIEQHLPNTDVWVLADKEDITKIISNLLNNALKYSKHWIAINLCTTTDHLELKITNDGSPIPESEKERIFEPFYRMEQNTDKGFGIGLPLARQLAETNGGSLIAVPQTDEPAFLLRLPLIQPGKKSTDCTKNIDTVSTILPSSISCDDHELPQQNANIMIVEDNDDLRIFLSEQLGRTFTVTTASNGQEALERLKQADNTINLVVTDIMMPVMNGYELCQTLKNDLDVCHIPIILLTAKNDLDSKIKGLRAGAEVYVEKPFSLEYLELQITTLLANRIREREAYCKHPLYKASNLQMNRADKEFLETVEKLVNQNLSNVDFCMDDLASELNMSRSTLLRKFKSLFDLTPAKFLQMYRLKRAAEFIQDGRFRIGEISTMTGFSTNSYFTRAFTAQFGISPKEYEQSQKKKNIGLQP